jgi:type I restriction enzyme S subunit
MRLQIPLPTREEQYAIACALIQHDLYIKNAKREVEKLRSLKFGLLQDLLTGRVRVKIAEAATT